MSVLAPGTSVPSFKLASEDGGSVTEQDLKGERTILVFYPFAFSPVCTDQLLRSGAPPRRLPAVR
jgi:peroxiredoxin